MELPPAGDLQVDVDAATALFGLRLSQKIEVPADAQLLTTWHFSLERNRAERSVTVPVAAVTAGEWGGSPGCARSSPAGGDADRRGLSHPRRPESPWAGAVRNSPRPHGVTTRRAGALGLRIRNEARLDRRHVPRPRRHRSERTHRVTPPRAAAMRSPALQATRP